MNANRITGQMLLVNNKVSNFIIEIIDGYAMSKFDDIGFMRKLVAAEQRHGNNNIVYQEDKKIIIEKFEGKNAKEITKIIHDQLKKSKVNITKK